MWFKSIRDVLDYACHWLYIFLYYCLVTCTIVKVLMCNIFIEKKYFIVTVANKTQSRSRIQGFWKRLMQKKRKFPLIFLLLYIVVVLVTINKYLVFSIATVSFQTVFVFHHLYFLSYRAYMSLSLPRRAEIQALTMKLLPPIGRF